MFSSWLKRRRRQQIISQPFPAEWDLVLRQNVKQFGMLTDQEQNQVRNTLAVFVAEKHWEGCGGLTISDEVKVTISALIAILVLGLDEQYFEYVLSILVYPDAYVASGKHVVEGGFIVEGDSAREGEAWYRGPVILSWSDVLLSGRGNSRGHNLVFHEFAHQLDMLNGRVADGIPPLESPAEMKDWEQLIHRTYRQLCERCSEGQPTVFDCYGATNIAEFFAVATETFFEKPQQFQRHHEELYGIFRSYYRQDPLDWLKATG
ncbi:MAG: zinc-dependent peptidase [Planctomycetaceae bacterium]|nr:zinc-dependent peptidase [Planctomycetaceae bacterium]